MSDFLSRLGRADDRLAVIAAIDAYFTTCHNESAYHQCRCAGCSAAQRELQAVLTALKQFLEGGA